MPAHACACSSSGTRTDCWFDFACSPALPRSRLCQPSPPPPLSLQVRAVSALGVPFDRIVFANPCKRPRDLRCMADRGVDLTTFDTEVGGWVGGSSPREPKESVAHE